MGNIFEDRLKALGINRQVDAAMVVAKAQETINKELGTRGQDNLRVISFSKGTLKIAATSGAWAAECRKLEDKLRETGCLGYRYVVLACLDD